VDDYVVKPIEQDKLLKKIARFFPNVKADSANE
jgi:two-component system, chemotaxis family, chemotaxis protein CheY